MNSYKHHSSFRKKRRSLNRSILNRHKFGENCATSSLLDPNEESCIKVIVRSRPLSDRETGKGSQVVTVVDEQLLIFDPEQVQDDFFFQGQKQSHRDLNKRVNKNVRFLFDRVFDGSCTNEEVFTESIRPVIDSLLSGFNCSVFAYGATGAGKTFTMLGAPSYPGIIFLIVKDLFQRIEEMENKTCELNVSYLEVYNETVKDLMRPSNQLIVRDDSKSVMVAGLTYQKPTSVKHLLELLQFGNSNRTQHPTDANAESSRSHAVFQIYLKIKERVGGLSEEVQISKMSLIDLAGSERACVVSHLNRARLREGANINQSLLALGTCINALAAKNGKSQHIPYRNSKLTRILKDSLGGNCKTVMIAAVSPSSLSYEDTYNTLKYAERAKGIKVSLKRNTANVDAHISGYKRIVDSLQRENDSLKRQLADVTESVSKKQKVDTQDCSVQTIPVQEVAPEVQNPIPVDVPVFLHSPSWKEEADLLCNQILKLKKNILDCESLLQSMQASQFWKNLAVNRISALSFDLNKITRSTNKLDTLFKSNQQKIERLTDEKQKNWKLLDNTVAALEDLLSRNDSEFAKLYLKNHNWHLDAFALRRHLDHAVDLSISNFKGCHSAWRLCEQALQQVRKQHSILKGHGFLTSDLISEFDDLLKQTECGREVTWADEPPAPNTLHKEFLQHLLLPSSGFECTLPSLPQEWEPSSQVSSLPQAVLVPSVNPIEPALQTSEFTVPHTPSRDNQSYSIYSSPPVSSSVSLILSGGKVSRNKRDSPYPNKKLHQLSTRQLLNLINNEDQAVRRSLEETFVTSTQGDNVNTGPTEWLTLKGNQDLQNVSFSPPGYQSTHSCRQFNFCMSTPTLDRTKSVDADFTNSPGPHSTLNTFNSHFLPEGDLNSHFELDPGEVYASSSQHGCQQVHLHPMNGCLSQVNQGLPHCSTPVVESSSTMLAPQQGMTYAMLPPTHVCPATVTRSGRLAPTQFNKGRVVTVLPSPRNPSSTQIQPKYITGPHSRTADRRPVVSSTNGYSRGTMVNRQGASKENLDPRRAPPSMRKHSGIQGATVSQSNRLPKRDWKVNRTGK